MNPVIQYINSTKHPTNVRAKKTIQECVNRNMEEYNTTEEEAKFYETHCHKCGVSISIGKKYCDDSCFKMVEKHNFDCYWKKSCKMCHIHKQYVVLNCNFEFVN